MRILRIAPLLRLPPRIGWLDYGAPPDCVLMPGDVAWVPFRGKAVAGLVLEETDASDIPAAKLATLPADVRPLSRLDPAALSAFREAAGLFHVPAPWLADALIPAVPRRAPPLPDSLHPASAGAGADRRLMRHRGDVIERYVEEIRRQRDAGRQVLIAVPDIGRGDELWRAFSTARLCVAFCHHDLAAGARWKAWNALARQESDGLIVTKAAALAPAPLLGLVIIDGEDDADHVQADAFPYLDTRLLHEARARQGKASLLVTSETPRFATVLRAQQEKWTTAAPDKTPLDCRIVPLRQEPRDLARALLSGELIDAAQGAVQSGKSVVALLNRTVQARSLRCADCGAVVRCATCGQTAAVKAPGLVCLRCGSDAPVPESCATCGGTRLSERGPGIDAVRDALAARLPGIAVHAVAKTRALPADGAAVFIATETIFKDARELLDRPLGLVAAIEADTGLRLPDYRAVERVWAQLERLANAARRHGCPLILQAWEAEHPALLAVRDGDPGRLAANELTDRKRYGYPPFAALWTIYPAPGTPDAERRIIAVLPDAELFPVEARDTRRAVRGRTAYRLKTSAALPATAASFARLPPDWIIEPEPERFS